MYISCGMLSVKYVTVFVVFVLDVISFAHARIMLVFLFNMAQYILQMKTLPANENSS